MNRPLPIIVLALLTSPALAIEPGWHISPLSGEGDRASLGCDRDATDSDYACLAVRCEDDYSVGVHVYTTRLGGDAGRWTMTMDRENRIFETTDDPSPYGARLADPDGMLLDRIRHGTFIYFQHADDPHAPFRYIDLGGSFQSIAEALYWCAPRVPPSEQNIAPDVDPDNEMEKRHEPSPAGTQ
ncbi:hypothetical protein [Devosia aurantiaca]|uniref:Uncharacterized protein n=1 Tax=Devosia aurantiaca TaxID=2714858 RepID=A0A6M1SJU1_9HYPH|nr:hypothetical protein [Devosia aurantiaca]NGP17074.1 hypothetical protein [Devosia aurantiaca]